MRDIVRNRALKLANAVGVHMHKWPSRFNLNLDYPVSDSPRYTPSKPHLRLAEIINERRPEYETELAQMIRHKSLIESVPAEQADEHSPFWMNPWLFALDAIALMHFLTRNRPARYIEIGSGNSTKFARHAITHGRLPTKITSIDPYPRAEIDSICDRVIRQPLEQVDQSIFDELESGDILFFDGSHRVFMDSDVTVFFLEVIPRLKPGVLIHIHDIFLPHDYPREWKNHYYSEQYMLAMLLLYGPYKTVFPCAFVAQDTALSWAIDLLPHCLNGYSASYWFDAVGATD